jgi:hypothetical protein
MILNLRSAPKDPIERIAFLDSVLEQVQVELDAAYAAAYFEARLQGRFEAALVVGATSRKKALAYTRRQNESLGRSVRWGDSLDRTSSAYVG